MNNQKHIKGELLSPKSIESVVNKDIKVIGVDAEGNEYLSTVVSGDFITCTGQQLYRSISNLSLRFVQETEDQYRYTHSNSIKGYDLYEAIEVGDIVKKGKEGEEKAEFKQHSGVFLNGKDYRECELICNQANLKYYLEELKNHRSFYISNSDDRLVFSIEKAIEMRDYLTQMIEVAKDNGYVDVKKEMTLEEVEKELGYKIKLV